MAQNIEMEEMQDDCNDEYLEKKDDEQKLREIFDSLDANHSGVIKKSELKKYVSDHPLDNVPNRLAKNIMKISPKYIEMDDLLNFKELCVMNTRFLWLIFYHITRFCTIVSPKAKPKPYEHRMSIYPPPLTMISFSLIEIVIFVLDTYYMDSRTSALLIYNPHRRFEVWRFFTYMFVHANVLHIVLNLIVQIFLGFALEMRNAWWRVALVYTAGVLAGSIANSIIEPEFCLRGASGGVYAIISAHVAVIIMNWSEMNFRIVRVFMFAVFLATDFGYSFYLRQNAFHVEGYTSHLFGALAGLLVGIGALKNFEERRWEQRLWWCAVSFYTFLMIIGAFIHIVLSNKFGIPSWNSEVHCVI